MLLFLHLHFRLSLGLCPALAQVFDSFLPVARFAPKGSIRNGSRKRKYVGHAFLSLCVRVCTFACVCGASARKGVLPACVAGRVGGLV